MFRRTCTALSLFTWVASADIRLHPLVYTQQPATGFPSGAVIAGLASSPRPLLNENGVIVFSAVASGGGVTPQNDTGIWLADEYGLRLLVREGDAVPGIDGRLFSMIWLGGLSADEDVWFLATMLGSPSNDLILCRVRPGEPVHVVTRVGEPVPGLPGHWVNLFFLGGVVNSWVNSDGALIFGGDTNMGNGGLFMANEPGVTPLLVGGDPIPGVPDSTLVSLAISPQWADNGVATVVATIAGPGITSANDRVVIACDTSGTQLIAREGDLIPGSETLYFGSAFLTDESRAPSDRAGFEVKLTGAGVTSMNDDALVFGSPGAPLPATTAITCSGQPHSRPEPCWTASPFGRAIAPGRRLRSLNITAPDCESAAGRSPSAIASFATIRLGTESSIRRRTTAETAAAPTSNPRTSNL